MRPGPACIVAALLAAPSAVSAGAPSWGIDGTTVVRRGETLRDHLIVVVSAWCTYVDEPAVWRAADDFNGEPDDPPTVGDNFYGCGYRVVEDGRPIEGAPWDAPRARDDVLYAIPRAKFPVQRDTIAAFENIPLAEFYPRMESGKDGILRANRGPSRGIPVPDGSPLVGFQDTLRAELRDGAFTLIAEQRSWRLRDGREVVEPLGDDPPAEPASDPAGAAPVPADITPEPAPADTPTPPVPADIPPAPVPTDSPHAPVPSDTPPAPVPADTATAPVPADSASAAVPAPPPTAPVSPDTPPARAGSLAGDLAIGGGALALGLFAGLALRRRR